MQDHEKGDGSGTIARAGFENYQKTSRRYDLTRAPIGVEVVLGRFANGSRALGEQVILDAGCGTGNYVAALRGKIAHVHGVEINSGMPARVGARYPETISSRLSSNVKSRPAKG